MSRNCKPIEICTILFCRASQRRVSRNVPDNAAGPKWIGRASQRRVSGNIIIDEADKLVSKSRLAEAREWKFFLLSVRFLENLSRLAEARE